MSHFIPASETITCLMRLFSRSCEIKLIFYWTSVNWNIYKLFVFQGMTLLIPAFVFMAFAHSASMMYIGLTLFAFGKWNLSLPLVFKSQNMQHLFCRICFTSIYIVFEKECFICVRSILSWIIWNGSIPLQLWEQSGLKSLACKDWII